MATPLDDWSLWQVEDEIRQAEAYLQQAKAPEPATPAKLSEARRKEILAKLHEEREQLRQGPAAESARGDAKPWDMPDASFLDEAASFPLPSPRENSPRHGYSDGESDMTILAWRLTANADDDEMSFLKELQRDGGDDTLYFASELPKPSNLPSKALAPSPPSSTTSTRSSPQRRRKSDLPKAVRFDILFDDEAAKANRPPAGLRKRTEDKTAKKAGTAGDADCTFRPKITPYRCSTARATGLQRLHELAAPRSSVYAKREKLKMEQELASLSSCTFTPNTKGHATPEKTTRAFLDQQISPNPKRVKVDEVTDRLYGDGLLRYELRDKVKRALEDRSVRATCTFKPKINPVTHAMVDKDVYKPIHARVPEIQRRKRESLRQLATSMEAEARHTFVPEINEKSRQLTHQLSSLCVTDRLAQDADHVHEKKLVAEDLYVAAKQALPFAPQLNERSKSIVGHKPEFKLDFVTRQRVLQDQRDNKLEHQMLLEERVHAMQKPFQPCIGNAEKVLQHTRPKRLTESTPEQLYRMAYAEPRKREERKKRLHEAYYNNFSFQPKLNTVSKALGRPTPIQRLAHTDATKPVRSRVVKEMELQAQAECRFRPELAPTQAEPVDRSSVWHPATVIQNIEREREHRRQKLEDKRHVLEFDELQRCTFAPTINRKALAAETSAKPVVVRGLRRFLELKERAKRQEAELREREAKVFHKTYTPRAYTVPAPFKLSYQDRAREAKRSRLEAELAAKEMQECTFQPATMEVRNRKLIQSLLYDEP
ncbi:hypothetical protein ACHHYP_11799 [Achlya hypogyna]|uniref:Uncharacterized protein n=1 Tax=Achlya hypogyna TaxID=1202772 RepID=A0A1V9YID8_ACHHY|nr:hypothetical protein ACHHYP_11799 [Achlya hypogyna]